MLIADDGRGGMPAWKWRITTGDVWSAESYATMTGAILARDAARDAERVGREHYNSMEW